MKFNGSISLIPFSSTTLRVKATFRFGYTPQMLKKILLGLAGCLLVSCSSNNKATMSPGPTASAIRNGQMIFQTGLDSSGKRIVAQRPPLRPSCAACHGNNGGGGIHLPGGAVSADLRHRALVTQQKNPYTLALLERAISTGIDNHGKPLNPVMPRWRLSKRDLHDVALYVLTQL